MSLVALVCIVCWRRLLINILKLDALAGAVRHIHLVLVVAGGRQGLVSATAVFGLAVTGAVCSSIEYFNIAESACHLQDLRFPIIFTANHSEFLLHLHTVFIELLKEFLLCLVRARVVVVNQKRLDKDLVSLLEPA